MATTENDDTWAPGLSGLSDEDYANDDDHRKFHKTDIRREAWPEELELEHGLPYLAYMDPAYQKVEEEIQRSYLELEKLVGAHKAPLPPSAPPPLRKSVVEFTENETRKQRCISAGTGTAAALRRAKQRQAAKYSAALPSKRVGSRPHSAASMPLERRESHYDPQSVSRVLLPQDDEIHHHRKPVVIPDEPVAADMAPPADGIKPWRSAGVESLPVSRVTSARTRTRPASGQSTVASVAAAAGPSRIGSARMTRPPSARPPVASDKLLSRPMHSRPQSSRPHLSRPQSSRPQSSRTELSRPQSSRLQHTRPNAAQIRLERPKSSAPNLDRTPVGIMTRRDVRPSTAPGKVRVAPQSHVTPSEQLDQGSSEDGSQKIGGLTRSMPFEMDLEHQLQDASFRDPYQANKRNSTTATIPLEWFDDPEFETRTPEEWLGIGAKRGLPATRAYSRYFKYSDVEGEAAWAWLKCDVLEYDPEVQMYLIEWKPSGPRKQVKRLNLLFEDEDRDKFYDRIEFAFLARARMLQKELYCQEIQAQTDAGVPLLPNAFKRSIIGRLGRPVRKDELSIVENCMRETEQEFKFSMKRADREFQNGTSQHILDTTIEKAKRWVERAIIDSGAAADDPHGRMLHRVAIATQNLSTYMFNANTSVQRAIVQVMSALRQVLPPEKSFFRKDHGLPVPFSTFRDRVEAHCIWVAAKLTYEWPRRVCEIIRGTLEEVFNFKETKKMVYHASRLRTFLSLVDAIMASQLSAVVLDGLLHALQIFSIRVSYPDAPLENAHLYTIHSPLTDLKTIPLLFMLQLSVVDAEGEAVAPGGDPLNKEGQVKLSPSFAKVENTLKELFHLPNAKTTRCIPHIETIAMTSLYFDDAGAFVEATIDHQLMQDGFEAVMAVVRQSYPHINKLVQQYAEYDFLLHESPKESISTQYTLDLVQIRGALARYRQASHLTGRISSSMVEHAPFLISCAAIQKIYDQRTREALDFFRVCLSAKLEDASLDLTCAYKGLYGQIVADPGQDAECLNTLQMAVDTCMAQIRYHNGQLETVKALWQLLYEYEIPLDDAVNEIYWTTCSWPVKLEAEMGRASERMIDAQAQIMSQLEIDREFVSSSLAAYRLEIQHLETTNNIDMGPDILTRVRYLRERIERVKLLGRSIPTREGLIHIPTTSLKVLEETEVAFEPHETLWTLVDHARKSIATWLDTYFTELDGPHVSSTVAHWKATVDRLLTVFAALEGPRLVIAKLSEEIAEFDRFTGVIASLRNPALRNKHWLEMSKLVGLTVQDVTGLTLRQAMDLDLELVQDILAEISREASNELEVENTLQTLFAELSTESFVIQPYVTNELFVIQNFPHAVTVFDDLLIRSTKLAAVSHSEGIVSRLESWIKRLQHAQTTLEAWQSLQTFFIRLYPLLTLSGESVKLTRDQNDNFVAITKIMGILTDILTKNHRYSVVLLRGDLHELITGASSRIDSVVQGIGRLIDAKRTAFPRFYFLSNDQILDMFAALPFVASVSPFLVHCFDGIKALILSEKDNAEASGVPDPTASSRQPLPSVPESRASMAHSSSAMLSQNTTMLASPSAVMSTTMIPSPSALISQSGSETVPAAHALVPFQLSKNRAIHITGVESFDGQQFLLHEPVLVTSAMDEWLAQLETSLKNTLRFGVITAAQDLKRMNVPDAVATLPTQIAALVGQVTWSRALANRQHDGAAEPVPKHMQSNLQECLDLLQAETTMAQRTAIESLITILLYTMDTLRLPSDEASHRLRSSLSDGNLDIHMMHHTIPYGYEFGAMPRLPMSPETNRCMGQVMNMLKFSVTPILGGHNAEGCLKDLATVAGVRCVSLDCSGPWQPGVLSRVLSGTIATGAWLCFGSLDSVDPSSLTVAAHHIGTTARHLTAAIKARTQTFSFENKEFPVNKTSAVFATSSRFRPTISPASLPNNFRNFFRPIILGVPDVRALVEAALYAQGFATAPFLARKIGILLKNLSRTLSMRSYDFHKIATLASVAGSLRTACETKPPSELEIIADACCAVYTPQLRQEDRETFDDISKSILDRASKSTRHVNLHAAITSAADKLHLGVNSYMLQKITQLYDSLCMSSKVFLVGDSMSGKSSSINLLKEALHSLHGGSGLEQHRVHFSAVSESQLLGFLDVLSGAKVEGILPRMIWECGNRSRDQGDIATGSSWIVLDGQVTPRFLEILSGLDSGLTSFSTFGSIVHLASSTRLICETDSLASINPGMLADAAIVYMDGAATITADLVKMLDLDLQRRLPHFKDHYPVVHVAQEYFLFPLLQFVKHLREPYPSSEPVLNSNVLSLFASLVDETTSAGIQRLTAGEQKCWILASYLFAVVWVVGCFPDTASRAEINAHVRKLLADDSISIITRKLGLKKPDLTPLSNFNGLTVYDCYFDSRLFAWTQWGRLSNERDVAVEGVDGSPDFIASVDATRVAYFVQLLVPRGHFPLIMSYPGLGKTTCVRNALNPRNLPRFNGAPIRISHTVHRTTKSLQSRMTSKLVEKRKAAFGCLSGKQAIAFVDDLNECHYSADSQNEVLEMSRALLEDGGWFGGKYGTEWTTVEDVAFVGAYNCRVTSAISPRYLRHFMGLALDDDVGTKLTEMMLPIVSESLMDTIGPAQLAANIVSATQQMLSLVQSTYRPTATNPQYLFGLKDAMEVLRTVLDTVDKSLSTSMISVWGHACHRKFRDVLTVPDQQRYDVSFREVVDTAFVGIRYSEVFANNDAVIFTPDRITGGTVSFWTPVRNFIEYCDYLELRVLSPLGDSGSRAVLHQDAVKAALNMCHNVRMGRDTLVLGDTNSNAEMLARLTAWMLDLTFVNHVVHGSLRDTLLASLKDAMTSSKAAILFVPWSAINQQNDLLSYIKWGAADLLDELMDDQIVAIIQKRAKLNGVPEPITTEEISQALLLHAHTHLRVIISATPLPPRHYWTSDEYFAGYLHCCARLSVPETSTETVKYLVRQQIPTGNELPNIDAVAKVLFTVSTSKSLNAEHTAEVNLQPSCLRTAIECLCKFYFQKHSSLSNTIQTVKEAMAKLQHAFDVISEAERSFHTWKDKLEDTTKRTEEFTKSLESERDALEKLRIEINRDTDLQMKLQEQVADVQVAIDKTLSAVVVPFNAARDNAERITQSELYEIRSMLNPSVNILSLCEALMKALKFEIKSHETVWDAAEKLFTERLPHLISAVEISAITAEQTARIQECMASPDTRPSSIQKTSRALGVLSEWLIALLDYHAALIQLHPQKQLADLLQKRIKDKEKTILLEQDQKTTLEAKLSSMRSAFDGKIKEKDFVLAQYKISDRKNVEIGSLKKTLDIFHDLWNLELGELKEKNDSLISESLLAALTTGYLSGKDEQSRAMELALVQDMLPKEGLPTTRLQRHPFSLCNFICDDKVEDCFISWGLLPDRFSCDNAFIARSTRRFPLVFDPHDRFEPWLKVSEKNKQVIVLDAAETDGLIDETLQSTMQKGLPLMIRIHFDHMSPLLEDLVMRSCDSNPLVYTTTKGEEIRAAQDFRIYFVIRRLFRSCSARWIRYLHPINNEVQLGSLTEEVANSLAESGSRGLKEEKNRIVFETLGRRNAAQSLSKKAKGFISEMDLTNGDFFSGPLYHNIMAVEEQLRTIEKVAPAVRQAESDNREQMDWLWHVSESPAKLCHIVIKAASITNEMQISVDSILESCRACLSGIPPHDIAALGIARRETVKSLLQSISVDGAKPQSRILLGFLLASELALQEGEANAGFMLSSDQLTFLLQDVKSLRTTEKLPRNPAPQWLEESRWQRVLVLGTSNPLFKKERLIMDFARFANHTSGHLDVSFEDVYRSLEPWKSPLPSKWNTCLTMIDRLLLLICIRPDSVYKWMEDYCGRILGDRCMDGDASAILNEWETANPPRTLLHLDAQCDDPAAIVRGLAMKKNVGLTVVALGAGNLDNTVGEMVMQAMEKGRWTLIYAGDADKEALTKLGRIIKQCERVHKNFRLWFSTRLISEIPHLLEPRSLRLVESSEIKQRLQMARTTLEENVNPFEFTSHAVYRAALLKLVYFHAVISLRSTQGWTDLNVGFREEQSNLSYAIRMLRNIFARAKNEKSAAIRAQAIGDAVYGCQLPDMHDRRLILAIFTEIMSMEWNANFPLLASMRPIYECIQRGDILGYIKAVRDIPSSTFSGPYATYLGPMASYQKNCRNSKMVMEIFRAYHGAGPLVRDVSVDQVAELLAAILQRFTHATVDTIFDCSVKADELEFKVSTSGSTEDPFDDILYDNIRCYRRFVKHISTAIEKHLSHIKEDQLDRHDEILLQTIQGGRVPCCWKLMNRYPISTLDLPRWTDDALARLAYVRDWHSLRNSDSENESRNLIVHDITKLWAPQALLQVIANGSISPSKTMDGTAILEGLVVSAKQTSLPDIGCYVSGLTLVGATWDKGLPGLKEARPGDLVTDIPCIWLQPTSRSAAMLSSKRNIQKVPCPLYIYKPGADEDRESMVALHEICLGTIDLPAEFPRTMLRSGAYIVCERPLACNLT
ncbi:hypothetical protein DFJ77DRAFT_551994 [Powellomyces hirtus]|nr:hypothetical protein DFJ77DRAFT_551994 [Powellomyces hirtus]